MNEEIKEILERVKKHYVLDEIQDNLLLDYISNLQERIAYLERSNNRRENTIIELRDENVEFEDYKLRIDKAIEYIKKESPYLTSIIWGDDLLSILRGDKE